MVTCNVCGVHGNEVRIFDAIYQGRMANLCERCSIIENIPLIKKPNASQLKESETLSVSDRMRQISGIKEPEKQETFFQEDKLKELDNNPELEFPEKKSLNLIEHFHWEIMKNRRRKGLSHQQLAESLGESELVIQMIEKSELPENAETLINKLEQFFQIKLRKIPEHITIQEQEPILLDEEGQEIEIIPEEEMVFKEKTEDEESKESEQLQPLEDIDDIDLKKIDKEKVTIGDLKNLHKKRSDVTKQEMIEEQKKIEERQKILLALRERDRIKMEERKKQEILERQKTEQQRQKIIEERKQELEKQRNEESKDINNFLGGVELIDEENKDNKKSSSDSIKEFDEELL